MTIYSAIFGQSDDLKEPLKPNPDWKHIMYTDRDDFESDVWEIRRVPVMEFGARKTARWYKINYHKAVETKESIWLDGTFFINCDLYRWWDQKFTEPFTTISHPFDQCIYKDANSCIEAGKGDPAIIKRQTELYRHLGIKRNSGLISSGILMRENSKEVRQFCKTWWTQVEAWSERDQISFGYAQFMHPGVHTSINWNYTKDIEFIHCPHKTKAWSKMRFDEIVKLHGSPQRR